jgi:TP901 family phage tail tape measure protein
MLDKTTMNVLPEYNKGLLDLSKRFGESTDTLSKGLYDILSASIDSAEALDVLEVASVAAAAGMTDTGTAADALTTLINAYGVSAEDAGYFSDILFATVKRGKTTMAELAPVIGTVATLASETGVSFKEVGAAIAVMTRKGIDTNRAMVALRSILAGLLKPSQEALETADELGISFGAQALAAEGLTGMMDKLAGYPPDVLVKLFPNRRAILGIVTTMGEMNGEIDTFNDLIAEGSPTLTAFAKQTDTFTFVARQMKQTIHAGAVTIGQEFLPGMKELYERIIFFLESGAGKDIIQFFTDLGTQFSEGVTNVFAFADAVGPVFKWFGELFQPVKEIITDYYNYILATFTDMTQIFFGFDVDAEKALNILGGLLRVSLTQFVVFGNVLTAIFKTAMNTMKAFVQHVINIKDVIVNVFKGDFKAAGEAAEAVWDNIKGAAIETVDIWATTARNGVDQLNKLWSSERTTLGELVSSLKLTQKELKDTTDVNVELFERTGKASEKNKDDIAKDNKDKDKSNKQYYDSWTDEEKEAHALFLKNRQEEASSRINMLNIAQAAKREEYEHKLKLLEEWGDIRKEDYELEIEEIIARKNAFIAAGVDRVQAEKWAGEKIKEINKKVKDDIKRKEKEHWDIVKTLWKGALDLFKVIVNAMSISSDRYYDKLIKDAEKKYSVLTKAEVDYQQFLKEQKAKEYQTLSDEEKKEWDLREAAAEGERKRLEELDHEKKRLQYEAAVRAKKYSLFEAVLSGANAILNALSTKPFWVGLILAGVAAVTTGIQIATIRNEPLPEFFKGGFIPKYAEGGRIQGKSGIDTNVIAATSGEYVVNTEATARNINLLEAINKGQTPQINITPVSVPLILNDQLIGEAMIEFIQEESERGGLTVNPTAIKAD